MIIVGYRYRSIHPSQKIELPFGGIPGEAQRLQKYLWVCVQPWMRRHDRVPGVARRGARGSAESSARLPGGSMQHGVMTFGGPILRNRFCELMPGVPMTGVVHVPGRSTRLHNKSATEHDAPCLRQQPVSVTRLG
jgi:hypothetical protein